MEQLKIVKLSTNAQLPIRASPFSAGLDLFSAENTTIPPQGKALVKTDLQVSVPEGCYGRVAPRSGLASKNFIDVGAGVIDADFRGNLSILLFNFNSVSFEVTVGMRVAQLICEKIAYPVVVECSELPPTTRGSSGFGSSGQ